MVLSNLFRIFVNDSNINVMAKFKLSLSNKVVDGARQVMVRATLPGKNQIRFQSGVWINPSYFNGTENLDIPRLGSLNHMEHEAATTAQNQLKAFINHISTICNVLHGHEDVTKENVLKAYKATLDYNTNDITHKSIKYELERREREENIKKQQETETQKLEGAKTFFDVMELYLRKKELSEARKRAFRVLMRQLSRYESFIRETDKSNKSFTLSIKTIDKERIEDFFDYFRNEKTLADDYPELFKRLLKEYPAEVTPKIHKNAKLMERGSNTEVKSKKMFKAFFHWCVENCIIDNNPFDGLKIGSEVYGTPFYLSLEERNLIAETDLEKAFEGLNDDDRATFQSLKPLPLARLAVQRDIFVFHCLIGCRVGDLLKLTSSNVVNGAIEYVAEKTRGKKPITVRVPLNKRALALVEKYKGVDNKGHLMPFIFAQHYNEAIKAVLFLCGIVRNVTVLNSQTGKGEQTPIWRVASSHMARRTFVGNLYKKVQDPNLVGSLSGHVEGSKAFVRYRDIDEDMKKNVVSLID